MIEVDWLAALRELARANKLSFTFNAGGGEYRLSTGDRCQIGCQNDREDYEAVREWLRPKGVRENP